MIGARTQPCFTPTSAGKLVGWEPAVTTWAHIPVWSCYSMALRVIWQPNLCIMFQRNSRLTSSNAFVKLSKAMYKSWCCSRHFYWSCGQQLTCHLCCVRAGARIEIQARQVQQRDRKDGWAWFQPALCLLQRETTTVATFCSVTFLLAYMNNVGTFPLLWATLSGPAVKDKIM